MTSLFPRRPNVQRLGSYGATVRAPVRSSPKYKQSTPVYCMGREVHIVAGFSCSSHYFFRATRQPTGQHVSLTIAIPLPASAAPFAASSSIFWGKKNRRARDGVHFRERRDFRRTLAPSWNATQAQNERSRQRRRKKNKNATKDKVTAAVRVTTPAERWTARTPQSGRNTCFEVAGERSTPFAATWQQSGRAFIQRRSEIQARRSSGTHASNFCAAHRVRERRRTSSAQESRTNITLYQERTTCIQQWLTGPLSTVVSMLRKLFCSS